MPLAPTYRRKWQVDFCVQGQPGLYKFQTSQGYTVRHGGTRGVAGRVPMVANNVHENFRSLTSSMTLNHEASARCTRKCASVVWPRLYIFSLLHAWPCGT